MSKASLEEGDNPCQRKDVMISYSRADNHGSKPVDRIRDILEENCISVWMDRTDIPVGSDQSEEIGRGIVEAKVIIPVLSKNMVSSRSCKDELSLAYVYKKVIFPICFEPPNTILDLMNYGERLKFARLQWLLLPPEDEACFRERLANALPQLQFEIGSQSEEEKTFGLHNSSVEDQHKIDSPVPPVRRPASRHKYVRSSVFFADEKKSEVTSEFWDSHFVDESSVSWKNFCSAMETTYKNKLNELFIAQEDRFWLLSVLKRELCVSDDNVSKPDYDAFCTVEGHQMKFFDRVQDQALESYTMKQVFDPTSSVRLTAVDNLSRFKNPAVIDALYDLLTDSDPNVRCVATMSLAKTGEKGERLQRRLCGMLNDKDRLVRQGACIALGHSQNEQSIPVLVDVWRNDFISSVREAAECAIKRIGGETAKEAIEMTSRLTKEMEKLMT